MALSHSKPEDPRLRKTADVARGEIKILKDPNEASPVVTVRSRTANRQLKTRATGQTPGKDGKRRQ